MKPTEQPAWVEPETPYPPRWRTTKRVAAAYAVVVVAFVCCYASWVKHARSQWDVTLGAIRRGGEPATHEDLTPPPVPRGQDAAPMLMRASQAAGRALNYRQWSYETRYDNQLSLTPDEQREVGALLEVFTPNLTLVREARESGRSRADWGVRPRLPLISTRLPHLSQQRDLAKLLLMAAIYRHETGDDAEAIELLRDVLYVSAMMEQGGAFLVTHLAAQGVAALAPRFVEGHAPALDCASGAGRGSVRALIADLLDERASREGWLNGWRFERVMAQDLFHSHVRNDWPEAKWRLDAVRRIDIMTAAVRASERESYANAAPLIPASLRPPDDDPARHVPQWRRGLARSHAPRMRRHVRMITDMHFDADRRFRDEFRYRLERRAAAVRLACRLHELDTRRLPRGWDELVPAYLPRAPADPFAPDGQPLRLARVGGNDGPLIVYSVGVDGVDNGGDESRATPYRKSHIGDTRPPPKPPLLHRRDIAFPIEHGPLPPDASQARPQDAQNEQHRGHR